MLRTTSRLLVPAAAALLPLLGSVPAQAAGFSTDPVQAAPAGTAQTVVSALAVGHHAGYDRLVLTFTGPLPGYSVAYVPQVVHDGSGRPVTLPGSAFVAVTLRPTSTAVPAPQDRTSPHFPMLREVTGAGDFEAVTTYGVGLAGRSGMRVLTLGAPNRLVVDFAIPAGSAIPRQPISGTVATSSSAVGVPPASGTPAGTPAGASAGGSDGSSVVADPTSGTAPLPGTGVPTAALAAGGVGLLVVGLGCYLVLRRRPV